MEKETGKKESASKESKNASQNNVALINTILTYLTLVGVGAIVGYTIFASIYNHRCSDMMDEAERNFNRTKEEMSMKLVEALHKNTANEGVESEVLELRGRLAGQADLMSKHHALLDKHQTTVERMNELQTSLTELQNCPKQVKQLENHVNIISIQKESAEKRSQQANEKIEQLLEEAKNAGASAACESHLSKSMTHLQTLYSTQCREKYVVMSFVLNLSLFISWLGSRFSFTSPFFLCSPGMVTVLTTLNLIWKLMMMFRKKVNLWWKFRLLTYCQFLLPRF